MISKALLLLVALLVEGTVNGSVSPETLCVCPGDEATFTCSVEGSGGVFTWITNATTETCQVQSSSPQSQCGQFIGQLQTSSLSTLTATSTATSDMGNIFIQCYYIVDLVGNGTLLIAGTPPPTPILHNVTSGDIQDNGDGDTHNVTLRWTLSEPDDCFNTIHFNVTPDDPTQCRSCEVGPGDPGMQEEFSCQVMQGIGQSCTYRVTLYAVRCGDTQNGKMSEPMEVNLTDIYNNLTDSESSPSSTVTNTPLGSPTPTVSNTPQLQVSPSSTVSNTPLGSPTPPVSNTPLASPTPPVSNTSLGSPTPTVSNTTQVPQDTECDCTTSGQSSTSTVTIAVVITFLMSFTLGSIIGVLVYHCICTVRRKSKQNYETTQPAAPAPVYEQVTTSKAAIELRENIAYGPI